MTEYLTHPAEDAAALAESLDVLASRKMNRVKKLRACALELVVGNEAFAALVPPTAANIACCFSPITVVQAPAAISAAWTLVKQLASELSATRMMTWWDAILEA